MTKDHISTDELWKEAFDMLIRYQNAPDNPVTQSMIQIWVARSALHAKIWQEALQLHDLTGKAIAAPPRIEAPVQPTRRRFLLGSGLALAGVAGLAVAPHVSLMLQSDILTQTAQIKTEILPDGSKVTMGPYSALDVNFTDAKRDATLLAGLAYFDVVPNEAKPFSLKAGAVSIDLGERAAQLELSHESDVWAMALQQGQATLRTSNEAVLMKKMQWARFGNQGHDLLMGEKSTSDFAPWRAGRIFVENEPVHAVLSRLSRWHNSKILIADTSLGDQPIGGVFNVDNLLSAASAVVKPYGGKARQISPWVTIISRV